MRRHQAIIGCILIIMILSTNFVLGATYSSDNRKLSSFEVGQHFYPQQTDWQTIWDSKCHDDAWDVAADSQGNSYVVGSSGPNAIILKFNITGGLVWNTTWSNSEQDVASAVATNSDGSVYVAGTTIDSVGNDSDVFILKVSNEGSLIWQRIHEAAGDQYTRSMTCDNGGNLAICGSSNNKELLALSYSSEGDCRWNKTLTYSDNCTAFDITHDSMDDLFITGSTLNETQGNTDLLLVRLSSDGEVKWHKHWSDSGNDIGYAVDICQNGRIAVTGYSALTLEWKYSTLPYLEFDPNGTLVVEWMVDLSAAGEISGLDLLCHSGGRIYIVGLAENSFFLTSTAGPPQSGGFGYSSERHSISRGISELIDGSVVFITTDSSSFSSDYITIERLVNAGYEEPERHEAEIVWEYSSDGIIEPLEAGCFSNQTEKSILCKLHTVESEWVEVINEGKLLWSYTPESASRLDAAILQSDGDNHSEVLLWYSRTESDVGLLRTLDQDGTVLWSWDNASVIHRVLTGDFDGDSMDEIAVETKNGIGLISTTGVTSWFLPNSDNSSYVLHSKSDYDGDGDQEIILSRTEQTDFSNKSSCVILDEFGNVLQEFPLYWKEGDNPPLQLGQPVILEAVNLIDDHKPEFYYALSTNGTKVSESIVTNDGEDFIWQYPWEEGRNVSSLLAGGFYYSDLDSDASAEILWGNRYGGLSAMEPDGRLLWVSYLGRVPTDRPKSYRIPLVDFLGNGSKGIIGGDRWVEIADPLTGAVQMAIRLPEGELKLCTNIDDDLADEIISTDINALFVIEYAGVSEYPTDYNYGPHNYPIIVTIVIAATCLVLVLVVVAARQKPPQYE
ncbi:hypothetical protein EU537_13130 [Candidatus Thorarchaeota archaeon]|nr:MAG: hypothetical protein EU537_13130 [Candidatus Thorarchaeota archaeon]